MTCVIPRNTSVWATKSWQYKHKTALWALCRNLGRFTLLCDDLFAAIIDHALTVFQPRQLRCEFPQLHRPEVQQWFLWALFCPNNPHPVSHEISRDWYKYARYNKMPLICRSPKYLPFCILPDVTLVTIQAVCSEPERDDILSCRKWGYAEIHRGNRLEKNSDY